MAFLSGLFKSKRTTGSEASAASEPELPFESKDGSPRRDDVDLEKSSSLGKEDEDIIIAGATDKIELTPMEALKWNVDGDQSPFPEVAACVPNTDDPTMEVNTFRMWVLNTVFVILFAGVNQFFSLRYPSLSLSYVVAQLLVFPIGRAWERLPTWRVGYGRFGFRINPGPFNMKEHAVIVICVNLTTGTAYAMGSLVAMTSPEFWGRDLGAGFGICYIMTTQFLGLGLAGLARRWIVYPAALIWPSTLASTVLFKTLHQPQENEPANGWTVTRYRFFFYTLLGSFVWFFFPDYIMTCLCL